MRCIETGVLRGSITCFRQINRNMRCIETTEREDRENEYIVINRNMRCIETQQSHKLCRTFLD